MKKYISLFVCLFVCLQFVNAQIQVKFNPSGEKLKEIDKYKNSKAKFSLQEELLPSFNLDSIKQEDEKRMDLGKPFKYGHQLSVNFTALNSGKWEEHDNLAIWRLKVKSKDAFSLGFHFSNFYLPEKAQMIIYNENESFMYGPLTSNQNSENHKFTTGPLQGDKITIELVVSKDQKDKVNIEISRIIHGYIDMFPTNSTKSANLSCHNNVACNANWDNQSDAVAKLIMGTGLCSGSLVNNTENDYRAYLLTAFHCVDTDSDGDYDTNDYDVDDYVFHFHYKSSTCIGTSANYIEYNSASYVSGWDDTDFALLEMDDSPVGNELVTWLGWDNRNNTPPLGACIHHPQGDIMKLSNDTNSLTVNNNVINWAGGTTSPANTHWTSVLNSGAIEGGSSGGPLFNQNARVVGQLHGGAIQCPPATIYYGQFHVSWAGNNTNTTQLENWLDPNTTGDPTTDLLRSPSITVPDFICYSGSTVSMQNPPSGDTITWGGTNVSYPNGNTGTSVTVRAASSSTSGDGTVTASFTVNGNQHTISHPVWVGAPDPGTFEIWIEEQWDQGNSLPKDGDSFVLCEGETYAVYMDFLYEYAAQGIIDTEFEFDFDYTIENEWLDYVHMTVDDFYGNEDLDAWVNVTNNCGTYYNFIDFSITNGYCSSGYYMMISPNPTTGETTLSIESTTEATNLKSASTTSGIDDDAEWELEIYSPGQTLKEKNTNLKGNSTIIQTAGWQEGVYVVRVNYKDEILTGKLVVKK